MGELLDDPLGTPLRSGERAGIRFERDLAHAPEKVWRAITESEHLRHWLPCDIVGERTAGAVVRLVFWPDHVERYAIDEPALPGAVRVWEPPRVFEWTWDTDVLRFELRPTDTGTHLTFTTWLGEAEGLGQTAAGYHVCLEQLRHLLDAGATGPLVDRDVRRWEEEYSALVRSAQ
jgi:uncharacterized protein YndB with AHSA1/START domain